MTKDKSTIRVGVLALQGSFREHMTMLQRIPGVEVVEIRSKEELDGVAGLIIPGGESTTMALVAERWGLIPTLQSFAKSGLPIWGVKKGGQSLLGGLDILVSRNFFGAQVDSFETRLPIPPCLQGYQGKEDFRAVFIRAPAVLETGPGVEPLVECRLTAEQAEAQGRAGVTVAVRSGVLLATAFHPELTNDTRWHELFVDMVRQHAADKAAAAAQVEVQPADALLGRAPNRPADMPVYGAKFLGPEEES